MRKKLLAAMGMSIMMAAMAVPAMAATPAGGEADSLVLNVGSDETEMYVTWFTDTESAETVQWAKKADMTDENTFPAVYQEAQAVSSKAQEEGSYSNKALITGLEANTEYVYRVGSGDAWSKMYEFSTENFDGSFHFLFAGDPQIGAGSTETDITGWQQSLETADQALPGASFLLSAGDQVNTSSNEAQYDGYLSPEEVTSIPMAVNVGNHDAGSSNYTDHFAVPNVSDLGKTDSTGEAGGDYWYLYNNMLVMSLNSNNMSTAEHRTFMEQVLAEHENEVDWTVVTFHHSVYSVASHTTDGDILQRRSELPEVFSDLGIDVVLMGHDHVYTRSYMMDGTTPVDAEDGPQEEVVNPGEREVFYLTANSASGSKYYTIKDLEFPFSAKHDQSRRPNLTDITVTEDSMTFTTYFTDDMSVLDTFTIRRTDVNTNALQDMIDKTAALTQDGYTEESWNGLQQALADAQAVIGKEDVTQEEADAAYENLVNAWNQLSYGNFTTTLQVAMEEAGRILNDESGNYQSAGLSELQDAYYAGQGVMQDENATQTEIDRASENILKALMNLKNVVNAERLQSIVELAEGLLQDPEQYTSESLSALNEAVEQAKTVIADEGRTQKEVASAYENMAKAIEGLVKRGDKAAIEAVLKLARDILADTGKYTEASLQGLKEAADAAQAVYDNADATQDAINEAAETLTREVAEVRMKGDVDGNSVVDTYDVSALLKASAEMETLDAGDADAADVNGDGQADTEDAAKIAQYAAEMIDQF